MSRVPVTGIPSVFGLLLGTVTRRLVAWTSLHFSNET
ncbi:uncharacterized protein J3R85_019590 [Psidium guajava]|nr:uncharacterized protein J3R85_019590 [Psidium guajava]